MSDKKCPNCGACKECGAHPQRLAPMPYPVYPLYPNYWYTPTWISQPTITSSSANTFDSSRLWSDNTTGQH